MKIKSVEANNRRKAFEIQTAQASLSLPYARLRLQPNSGNRVRRVAPDPDLGNEAFTYELEDGREDTVHLDAVLEYNEDPEYLRDLLLYELTLEARKHVEESGLSKRELIRRLGTSASQFYRLLDPTNTSKSVGQLLALLHVLNCDVDLVVRERSSLKPKPKRRPELRSRNAG
jgi:hypothetical protein